MKYIKLGLFILIATLTIGCEKEKSKYATVTGEIANLPSGVEYITIQTKTGAKNITVENGKFSDTINMDQQFCILRIVDFNKAMFLNNDYDLNIEADYKSIGTSIEYTGKGANENKYLNEREQFTRKIFSTLSSVTQLEKDKFEGFKDNFKNTVVSLLEKHKPLNERLLKIETDNMESFLTSIDQQYIKINSKPAPTIDDHKNKPKANVDIGAHRELSPQFVNLENYDGGTTSLKDLRGNLVYIDIWATWCPPCKAEIPYLKKIEKKFHGKPVKFVSLSVDKVSAHEKWKNMISEKQMGGVQLFAGDNAGFVSAYNVTGIPRFILLDKKGRIINENAVRPSSGQLEGILNSHL